MPARRKPSKLPEAIFSSVDVLVSNRKRSAKWYTNKLGLNVIADDGHWLTVGRKGRDGVLHLCQASDFDVSIPLERRVTGICLKLPRDFEAACAALKGNGVEFNQPPTKKDWGWSAQIVDPDGNVIDLHSVV